jgi:hypothetical protein
MLEVSRPKRYRRHEYGEDLGIDVAGSEYQYRPLGDDVAGRL